MAIKCLYHENKVVKRKRIQIKIDIILDKNENKYQLV